MSTPSAPKKPRNSEPKILQYLIDIYKQVINKHSVPKLKELINETFKYLELYFDDETVNEYGDELEKLIQENYQKDKSVMVYDILNILNNISNKYKSVKEQENATVRQFSSILDQIDEDREDENAVTLTEDDLNSLVDEVRKYYKGDEIIPHERTPQGQIAHDKLFSVTGGCKKQTRKKRKNYKKSKNTIKSKKHMRNKKTIKNKPNKYKKGKIKGRGKKNTSSKK